MARGDAPVANSAKIRRTTAASASVISRPPRTGSPGIVLAHDAIAEAVAAARAALLDPAPQPAMGLGRQILEEQRVHRALEADMQLADLALGQRDQPHARHSAAA